MNGAPAQARSGANLIRPEQVDRLPHLSDDMKRQVKEKVTRFWDFINTHGNNSSDPKLQQAYTTLAQMSSQLMQGYKNFQQKQAMSKQNQQQQQQNGQQALQQAQQAQQQQQQQAAPQPPPPPNNAASIQNNAPFESLMPEVQQRVSAHKFIFPPAMIEGSEQGKIWLREAQTRFGQALQRAQLARNKRAEITKSAQERTQRGIPLNDAERQVFEQKVAQCDKAMRESSSFMEKFKEQQQSFSNQRAQRFSQNAGQNASVKVEGQQNMADVVPPPLQQQQQQPQQQQPSQTQPNAQGPQAYSIATAQAAARAQSQGNASGAIQTPTQPSTNADLAQASNQFNPQSANASMPQGPTSRPQTANALQAQQAQASHAHPQNIIQQTPASGVMKSVAAISKTIQTTEPHTVAMPPSRPTLSGGAGVGLPGQLAQPALQALPGYVLETSEDGHLLSRKKLNEVVREVLGPHSEDMLTSDAEEICLNLVDNFIDDLLTAACRLAKLRNSPSLELRDIQVILERQYNIRVPGFSTDEVRTVRRQGPTNGWVQKMSVVAASKYMAGAVGGKAGEAS